MAVEAVATMDRNTSFPFVVDPKYEFSAPHFFDFAYEESCQDVKLVERWFETAFSHEASPQIVKGKTFHNLQAKYAKEKSECDNEAQQLRCPGASNRINIVSFGVDNCLSTTYTAKDLGHDLLNQEKEKSFRVSSSSTLAGKKRAGELILNSLDQCAQGQMGTQNVLTMASSKKADVTKKVKHEAHKHDDIGAITKKQKIRGIFTRQVVELAEPFVSLAEKVQKFQMGTTRELRSLGRDKRVSVAPRKQKLKLTKPKEPELETSHRIRASRVKSSAELEEEMLSKIPKFKARPVNKKILKGPTLQVLPKKTPQMPEFEEFRLRTMERALRYTEYAGHQSSLNSESQLITRRSRKALKPIKESQPEKEHEVEECKPGHLGEHTELTDLRGNDNLKVLRPRKPLARMEEFSNSNSLGSNRPYLTRLASKKHATEATIKGTEYPNKVAVNMQDSVNPKKTRGWQTLKQDSQISPQRSKIKPGPRVSPRRGGLKRRESSQAQLPATLKKLHFR
ncbi:hypothetical protein O6H91_08G098000 [Diphasiastrum complanatum]|uniref:Uncharacterized protein n=1 Tax=Diphasiastrum complanatum TaxID=34168 RepID=A0ACC2D0H6_DIPCM|nr:hypothetical protein O6H91_08G098000 [Diphasiastrum complanatum]